MSKDKQVTETKLSADERVFFLEELRHARGIAAADNEGFQGLLFAFEGLGMRLTNEMIHLGGYREAITDFASESALFTEGPSEWHTPFPSLYQYVKDARNDAMHQGAFARNLAAHAVQMALVLEDALMEKLSTVSEVMVRNPIVALPWQPVSFVRQQMLSNGYSYVPIWITTNGKPRWCLLWEGELARYLRLGQNKERKRRLAMSVETASKGNQLKLIAASTCSPDLSILAAVKRFKGNPLLVVDSKGNIMGILSAADLL